MDHKRLLRHLISLTLCVLATASACGPRESGSSAIQPGEWEGTGDQEFKIDFTVAQNGNALTFYGFFYPLTCTKPGGFESVVSESNVPLNGSQFELSGTHFRVTAKFVTPERAEGTWTVEAHRSPQFGDCRETDGTWVARPKGANTPTSVPPIATSVPPTASPTATSVPPTLTILIPMDGHWTGTTSSDESVSFDISDRGAVVTNFQLTTGGTCAIPGGICGYSIFPTIFDPIAITNGQFAYSSSTYSFDGEFTSATTVSGNYIFKEYGATCMTGGAIPQSHTCYHSATGTWTATLAEDTTHTPTPKPTVTPTHTPTLQPSATPTPKVQSGTAPILESVNLRYDTSSGSLVVFQDITFHDPDGDSYWVDCELVHTTAAGVEVRGGAIEISSRQQKLGATITGEWTCGGSKYDVTLRVTILDRTGNKSNAVEYTMNCR